MARKPRLNQPWLRFLVAGAGTTLISQGLLIVLLNVAPVAAAAFLSQLTHATCGYFTSAKAVFGCSGSPWRYGALFGLSWLMQWLALSSLLRNGWPRLYAVAALVPVLAISSYGLQRKLVFR
jgi:hypothetical protein